MVNSWPSRLQPDMGQMSSQLQAPLPDASTTEHQGKGRNKGTKSKKRKRKSAEMERPIDQEDAESAFTLMQISKAQIQNSRAPYYEENHALSAQLPAGSPPMRSSTEPVRRSKSRKTNNKRRINKRGRTDVYDIPSSDDPSNGAEQYPDLPSSPPSPTGRSSLSPYRRNFPPINALDDIPTDDEDVAEYEEYAKDTASTDPPALLDHDIFSFSQQPPNHFDQDEVSESIHHTSQLPTNVHALPQSAGTQKKKKRKRRTDDQAKPAQQQGQHTAQSDFEAFDDLFQISMGSANLFLKHKGDDMPIDPKLHSINTFPSSTDLGRLNDEDLNVSQKSGKGVGRRGSSQPRKRRRLEEIQGVNTTDLPYMSPYSFEHDQEKIKDQVLPGFEDMQEQSSPRLGSTFPDNAANEVADFSGGEVQVKKNAQRKKQRESKKPKVNEKHAGSEKVEDTKRAEKKKAENGGAFSAAEGLQLDAFRDNHCEANDMTTAQFNSLIQTPMRGNAQVTALFNEIHDVLPYRPRMSVQKFCRRRFHNYVRGTWNADDDEMLKYAVIEKGKAWKEIGDSLGRMPEDCRDRWRNYLDNSEHRNREQWTDAEVVNLCTAILDCMQAMKEDRMRAKIDGEDVPDGGTESDQEVEDMKRISWQAVSDRMGEHGGGRSRLQCSFKWSQLKKREQDEFLNAVKESRDIDVKKSTPAKNPWRARLASRRVGNMKPGDMHALLQAVLDTDVPEEGNIPWKSLGDDELRATWTSMDKKMAWSRLKEKVTGYEVMDYRSIANELLSRTRDEDADALDERWDPELHGDVSQRKSKRKRRKAAKERDKGKGREDAEPRNRRSNEFVIESDGMDGDGQDQATMGAYEPQGHNRYNALSLADDMNGAEEEDDLFIDGGNANGHRSIAGGDLSPEFAGRLQSALTAFN